MNISMEDLNILQKYCDNRLDYDFFLQEFNNVDDNYAKDKWSSFQNCPIRFITSEGRKNFLENILKEIGKTNYRG